MSAAILAGEVVRVRVSSANVLAFCHRLSISHYYYSSLLCLLLGLYHYQDSSRRS